MVTYNRREDVACCLDSVIATCTNPDDEILVIDNGSTDGTAEMLANYPKIQLNCWPANQGLSLALVELIKRSCGNWLLFLDSDTILPEGGIESLLKFAQQNDTLGAVAPRVIDMNGDIQFTARDFPGAINGLFGRQTVLSRLWPNNPVTQKFLKVSDQGNDQPFRCDWVAFAAALVRRKALHDAGSIDEGYFVYWVDADFFRRVCKAGWEVWCYPEVEIIHMEHNRTRQIRHPRAIRDFHYGAFRYFYKHHGWKGFNPLLWFAAAALLLRTGLQLAINRYRMKAQKS